MTKHSLPERQLPKIEGTQIASRSRFFQVESLKLTFANGEQREFERLQAFDRSAVMIVPFLGDDMLLIREYAAGVHGYPLSFPKGLVEEGEPVLEAANRELQEEVHFAANTWHTLREVTGAPNYTTLKMHLVVAKDLSPSELPGDEPEPIEVIRWPWKDRLALLEHPDFHESRAIAALYLLEQHPEWTP